MRNWKNWLLPILTLLTVAALALLPLRLSTLEDSELAGAVHTEPLAADNNFPSRPPELPGRVWLLAQWQEMPENLTIMSQELESADRSRETQRLWKALAELLSPEAAALFAGTAADSWDWTRYYLRDQADLASASFTVTYAYDKSQRTFLSATLDGESGQILRLDFHSTDGVLCGTSPLELGKAILDRMELEYTPEDVIGNTAYFRLPDCKSLFWIIKDWNELDFNFSLDWSAMDRETAVDYGHEPTDAGLIQKR